MAVQLVVGDRRLTSKVFGVWLRNIFAGSICSILSIAFGLSYAALIFSGPLAPWLAYGIAVTFLSTAVSAFVVALRSSLPFAIAGPDTSTSAVTAGLAASLVGRLIASGAGSHLLEPTLIVMAIGSALAGILLCGLGIARAGRVIRFVPYPVIGGFLGATGWLTVAGAIKVMTDRLSPSRTSMRYFGILNIEKNSGRRSGGGGSFSCADPVPEPPRITGATSCFRRRVLPRAYARGRATSHGGNRRLDVPTAGCGHPHAAMGLPRACQFPLARVAVAHRRLAGRHVRDCDQHVAQHDRHRSRDPARSRSRPRSQYARVANLLSAALGGYVSCVSLSRSTLNYAAGATGRLAEVAMAAIMVAMLLVNPSFLAYVPKFVLGGLLLYLGVDLLYRWLVVSRTRLSIVEYASLVAIVLIIVKWDFIAGVFIGVVIGCATFALNAGRVNAIKFSFDGTAYRSSLDRGPSELALLAAHGRELRGMSLQSYLFFGTANRLYQHVKELLASNSDCRFLVFDLGMSRRQLLVHAQFHAD